MEPRDGRVIPTGIHPRLAARGLSAYDGAVILDIAGLDKWYGSFHALKSVTTQVPEGAVGLLGPNGAGKSTLLKVVLGLLDFARGEVRVLGRDVRTDGPAIRARIGYMPESEAFFPGFTAHEMVVYGARLSGLPEDPARKRAHILLDYVQMGEERYRPVDTLSTGMKQKVKLAQALVHDPRLVLLDEPTNGLDPRGREEMLGIVADLPRHGISVILSSHLLHDVERVCDTVMLMDEGQVLHTGPLAAFRSDAERRYEVRTRGAPEPMAAALEAAGCRAQVRDDGLLLVALPEGDDVEVVWRAAEAAGASVRHLKRHERTLQDAFVHFIELRRADGATAGSP